MKNKNKLLIKCKIDSINLKKKDNFISYLKAHKFKSIKKIKIKLHKTHVKNQLLLHVYLPSHATSTREQCLVYYSPVLFFFVNAVPLYFINFNFSIQTSLFNQKKIIDLSTKSKDIRDNI